MRIKQILLLMSLMLLTDCGVSKTAPQAILQGLNKTKIANFCSVASPIRYSKLDTIETKKQAVAHNTLGTSLNCW